MRSIKEIMSELGFSPDAPEATQRAFIKHLIQTAQQKEQQTKAVPLQDQKPAKPVIGEQLEFDLSTKKQVS